MMDRLRAKARQLKTETYALYLAYRDPRVPWYAKVWVACVVAYAFSPIDLVPDFIPILGYLDDLVLIPLGIAIALKLIPAQVLDEKRIEARELIRQGKPISRAGAIVIIVIWIAAAALAMFWIIRLMAQRQS